MARHPARRELAGVLAMLALAGCSQLRAGNIGGAGLAYQPANLAELRWRVELASPLDIESRPRFRGSPAYDSVHDIVYAGSSDHGLYAIRGRDGMELWRFQTLGAVEGSPIVADGTVFVGSDDGAMYAINAETGQLRWRFGTVAEVIRPPVVLLDSVFFVNSDDTVFAVSRDSGVLRWRYRREPPGGITVSGHAGLLRVANRLFTGFSDGNVVAIDVADGAAIWERDTSTDNETREGANEAHRAIDVDTTPVLLDGVLLAASYSAGLYALDPSGGGVRWRVEGLTDISAITTDGRDLYATSATLGLLKVDPSDGSVVWDRDLGSHALQDPLVAGAYLVVPSADQTLWFVRTRDGEPVQGLLRDGVSAPPTISTGWMYFSTNSSVLYAYRLPRP